MPYFGILSEAQIFLDRDSESHLFLAHHVQKICENSLCDFLSNLAQRETNKQTNKP